MSVGLLLWAIVLAYSKREVSRILVLMIVLHPAKWQDQGNSDVAIAPTLRWQDRNTHLTETYFGCGGVFDTGKPPQTAPPLLFTLPDVTVCPIHVCMLTISCSLHPRGPFQANKLVAP
jgi:hypothetical protein